MESHYSQDRSWSQPLLEEAESWLTRLRDSLSMMECAPTDSVIEEIIDSQADNLDTPRALSAIKSWITKCEAGSSGGAAGELSRALDSLLGLAI